MSYELVNTADGVDVVVSNSDRESLYREALTGVLDVLYHDAPPGAVEGQALPIQAAGDSETELLDGLVRNLLYAASTAPGRLRPPRWMAFDTARVTANLPEETRPVAPALVEIASVSTAAASARLSLRKAPTH